MIRKGLLLAFALLPVTAVASAAPGTSTPTKAIPPGSVSIATPLSCTSIFDGLLTQLKAGDQIHSVHTTLIDGEIAYAEGKLPVTSGFSPPPSSAKLVGQSIAIQSVIATPGGSSSSNLAATLDKSGDKVRLKWTHAGKSHMSTVDNCSSGFWTATDSSSAFAVKLGKPVPTVTPE